MHKINTNIVNNKLVDSYFDLFTKKKKPFPQCKELIAHIIYIKLYFIGTKIR